ncbi:tyrosine-protein phosphatase [Microbacterium sp. No. 7]|uniref:tyrosine-protein phosphatase n=1 Tax=Microbacterium sp. No. 7 TaxID=1714373 RepID=UPI0009E7E453|nr:tyrosine-protein phosphatase [Microbacterium sp. No. 7]
MRTIGIDGLFNARATEGAAPWLVRTGAPGDVGPDGAAALRALGVTVVVDLREPSESGAASGTASGTADHGIPVRSVHLYGTEPPRIGRLEDIYEGLLRERCAALAEAVVAVADAEGAALVHCTAGKDRTGLVVALARLAAGAAREEVVADYERSGDDVRPVRAPHALAASAGLDGAERAETLRLHLESPREAIVHALAVVDELGGVVAYLRRHGLDDARLARLRQKERRALDEQRAQKRQRAQSGSRS